MTAAAVPAPTTQPDHGETISILGTACLALFLILALGVVYSLIAYSNGGEVNSFLAPLFRDSTTPGGNGRNLRSKDITSESQITGTYRVAPDSRTAKFADGTPYTFPDDATLTFNPDHTFKATGMGTYGSNAELLCLVSLAGHWNMAKDDYSPVTLSFNVEPSTIVVGRSSIHPVDAKTLESAAYLEAENKKPSDVQGTDSIRTANESQCATPQAAANTNPFNLMRRDGRYAMYREAAMMSLNMGNPSTPKLVYERIATE